MSETAKIRNSCMWSETFAQHCTTKKALV